METDIKEIFIKTANTSRDQLSLDIWTEISRKIDRKAKFKSIGFASFGLFSFVGLIVSIVSLVSEFEKLGFFEYVSLLFSDGSFLATYWKEYTLTLADSIPFASLGVTLFLVFALFFSTKKTFYYLKNRLLIA